MIVPFAELETLEGPLTLVDGAFDPLHDGHVEYFRAAAALGNPLVCHVASDHYLSTKHPPLLKRGLRARVIDALADIDYVVADAEDTESVLDALKPAVYAKGEDWRDRLPEIQRQLCRRHGIDIVYLDTLRNSSSGLLERFAPVAGPTLDELDRFDAFLQGQQSVPPDHYDDDYFLEDWRAGHGDYSVESRREIEGRHPRLVREVFAPASVLDMGCGPGAFLFLLEERGVIADGIDVSPRCRELAPETVRGRIRTASLLDPVVADRSYDLVICREVLEHLTVLQIREAVRRICRASSRLVYVTTRFHPAPASLLDVTTEPDVDPTHISLMNQDLLRLLFTLEGFRRRADLERRIDWMRKERALVYERMASPIAEGPES